MKRVKCFGKKQTNLVETSATKAFFDNFFAQNHGLDHVFDPDSEKSKVEKNESCCSSACHEVYPSIFASHLLESRHEDELEFKDKIQKLPFKKKAHIVKLKKYKGKRKFRSNLKKPIKQYEKVKANEPRWSSIYEHDLAIEQHVDRRHHFSGRFTDLAQSRIQVTIPEPNSFQAMQSIRTALPSIPSLSENIPDFSKSLYTSLKKLEIGIENTHKVNKYPSASPFSHCKSVDQMRTKDKQAFAPYTSTPIMSPNKFYNEYNNLYNECNNLLDLSDIPTKQQSIRNKSKLTFEYSFASQIRSPTKCSRSLKISKLEKFDKASKKSLQSKSHSNIERSIYLKSHSSLKKCVIEEENEHSDILPKLLELCNQSEVLPFTNVYNQKKTVFKKVGEGSYGEVFMVTQNKKSFVIKVIPVSEDFSNSLQSMESVYSEIKVSQCLSNLRNDKNFRTKNFNLLKKVYVVQGSYPDYLLDAWDVYGDEKTTYNIRPDVFEEQQIFVILELEYGGKDLTSFVLRNGCEAESVYQQTAISLAIAEESHLFEHRDLHLGNILVQRNNSKNVSYILRGKPVSIPSNGLLVTIIDFTLSRILDCGVIFYNDLADDESLFNQSGDFQFEVYRATKLQLKNQWHECLLFSNVLWLTFLCKKLEEHDFSRPSSVKHAKSIQNLKMCVDKMKQCKSALECLETCNIISVPEKIDQTSMLSKNTVFVDRKSLLRNSLAK